MLRAEAPQGLAEVGDMRVVRAISRIARREPVVRSVELLVVRAAFDGTADGDRLPSTSTTASTDVLRLLRSMPGTAAAAASMPAPLSTSQPRTGSDDTIAVARPAT